jgi:hypothetical protein
VRARRQRRPGGRPRRPWARRRRSRRARPRPRPPGRARRRRPGRALRPASAAASRAMRRHATACCSLSGATHSSPHSIRHHGFGSECLSICPPTPTVSPSVSPRLPQLHTSQSLGWRQDGGDCCDLWWICERGRKSGSRRQVGVIDSLMAKYLTRKGQSVQARNQLIRHTISAAASVAGRIAIPVRVADGGGRPEPEWGWRRAATAMASTSAVGLAACAPGREYALCLLLVRLCRLSCGL